MCDGVQGWVRGEKRRVRVLEGEEVGEGKEEGGVRLLPPVIKGGKGERYI